MTDQQEKVGADIKAARTVLVGLYGSTFIDEPRRPRLTAAENKALGDLLADHAALTFDSVNLRDEVGEWKANANKAEGVIAAQAEEIERLRERLANETDAIEGVETQLSEANIAVVSAEAKEPLMSNPENLFEVAAAAPLIFRLRDEIVAVLVEHMSINGDQIEGHDRTAEDIILLIGSEGKSNVQP